jgi:hypothetical protein
MNLLALILELPFSRWRCSFLFVSVANAAVDAADHTSGGIVGAASGGGVVSAGVGSSGGRRRRKRGRTVQHFLKIYRNRAIAAGVSLLLSLMLLFIVRSVLDITPRATAAAFIATTSTAAVTAAAAALKPTVKTSVKRHGVVFSTTVIVVCDVVTSTPTTTTIIVVNTIPHETSKVDLLGNC